MLTCKICNLIGVKGPEFQNFSLQESGLMLEETKWKIEKYGAFG